MISLKVVVTKDILEMSKNCGTKVDGELHEECAIKNAIREIFPEAVVYDSVIYPFPNEDLDHEPVINLPAAARDFIKSFDVKSPQERLMMDELQFDIEIPDSILAGVNLEELKPLLQNRQTLELV